MVVDLARWLGEQLDEDERIARAARDAEFCKDGRWIAKGPFEDGLGSIHSEAGEAVLGEEESVPFSLVVHIAAHDPARVLREIDAKREIIAAHPSINVSDLGGDCGTCVWSGTVMAAPRPCPTLRLLALPYADRPGYQEAWRP